METLSILAKVVVYSLFAFAFYTWNKSRINTDFNKRSMFYLILLLASLLLVIYVDFIENFSTEIKGYYFQYANYSMVLILVVFSILKKNKDHAADIYFKPRIALLVLWTIFTLYQIFLMDK
jgi:hypothetical protein